MVTGTGWHEWDETTRAAGLRTEVAHPARMYDYYLGGKDNFPADREAAERAIRAFPPSRDTAVANRAFLGRAVRFAARELGIRQFLDIGTGIPTRGNTNEVAHQVAPDARVVYVDNDPIVLTHARALLEHGDEGRRTSVMLGDLREPEKILAEARSVLDFGQPVALMLVAILHFIRDQEEPGEIVEQLVGALPAGSALILSHGSMDLVPAEVAAAGRDVYDRATAPLVLRSVDEIVGFFTGTELVEPGVVQVPFWRPDGEPPAGSDRVSLFAGVGVKH